MAVETLGHSAAAYKTAKVRLQRKFGGQRRKMALHLEQLESIKFVLPGNTKDMEKFADLLDILVVNIKDVNHHEELGKRTLYVSLCRKSNESMLAHTPVEKSDVVLSIALNVAGVQCYIFRFYSIVLGICFVVLAYRGSVVVYMVDLMFYRMTKKTCIKLT